MHATSTFTRFSARGLAAVALAALLFLSACGSSDDDSGASGGDDDSSSAPSDDTDSNDDAPAPDNSGGNGTGTLTMADGTAYEFEMNSCDTSDTDPTSLPLSLGYDLTGATADGAFRLFLVRAGFDDESVIATGSIEGDFDEDGQNAGILYTASDESMATFVVDGGNVSGALEFGAIGPAAPHGEDTTATIEVSC